MRIEHTGLLAILNEIYALEEKERDLCVKDFPEKGSIMKSLSPYLFWLGVLLAGAEYRKFIDREWEWMVRSERESHEHWDAASRVDMVGLAHTVCGIRGGNNGRPKRRRWNT
jgi:hypothetical protein